MAALKVGSKVTFKNTARGLNQQLTGKIVTLGDKRHAVDTGGGAMKTYNPYASGVTAV